MAIKLGDKVRDTITGFEGVVVAQTLYLNGCTRFGVQPKLDKDGKIPEAQWFDHMQLEPCGEVPLSTPDRATGGPGDAIPKDQANPKL